MDSRKRQKPPPKRPATRRYAVVALVVVAVAVLWVALAQRDSGVTDLLTRSQSKSPQPADSAADSKLASPPTSAPQPAHEDAIDKLVGRWQRPDGGYIVEIRGLDKDGHLDMAYFNPRPINVSRTAFIERGDTLHVLFELMDVGYPGAAYNLVYDPRHDALVGLYYQPTAGQTFNVEFARMR
ncbi:MAG: hypothetical protein JSW50_13870 [Candidatus Latescibacterota bacterium]|nr:MAG: hypothetical protein JSW50_13870 [Candidatus Latescibacterota bacterium]